MFTLSDEEHNALEMIFEDNNLHGRRGMDDLPKIHLVDITDGNRKHPVMTSIKTGYRKSTGNPHHIGSLISFRKKVA